MTPSGIEPASLGVRAVKCRQARLSETSFINANQMRSWKRVLIEKLTVTKCAIIVLTRGTVEIHPG